MPARSAASRASLWARTLKPMIAAPEAVASVTSDFGDAADAGMDDARHHLVGAELVERADDGLERALHVGLDQRA